MKCSKNNQGANMDIQLFIFLSKIYSLKCFIKYYGYIFTYINGISFSLLPSSSEPSSTEKYTVRYCNEYLQ